MFLSEPMQKLARDGLNSLDLADLEPFLKPVTFSQIQIDEDGCWIHTGCKPTKNHGYSRIGYGGKSYMGHVLVWTFLVGEPPSGLDPDHICHDPNYCKGGDTCKHRACLNPAHIEWVTHAENIRRGCSSHNLRVRTHCANDHEFTPDNTYIKENGARGCKKCRADRQTRFRRRSGVPPRIFRARS